MAGDKPNFSGEWEVYKQENFDEFLQALGANVIIRKTFGNFKPTVKITQDGDNFHIKYISKILTREETFTVGQEYEQKEMQGATFTVTAMWEDNKLIQNYSPKKEGDKARKTTRELVNGEIYLTQEVDGVVARRYFKKIS